jgi:hypothetical protein
VLRGIAVRNGSIANFSDGVVFEAADGSIVEGLRVSGARPTAGGIGIIAHGIVRGNTLFAIPATAIIASGIITGNYVNNNGAGISAQLGSTVIGNTALNNTEQGIAADCPANLTDNTAVDNGINLRLNGNDCHSEDNLAP